MRARDLLMQLEACKKGQPITLPVFIQPDFYFPMNRECSHFYMRRLRETIESINPPYIEVTDWHQLAQVHYIQLENGFFAGMKFLFSLPVNHLHFTFGYMNDEGRLVDRATHFLTQACFEHLSKKMALPVFTYHCRDASSDKTCRTAFTNIMTSAGHHEADVVDAKAALYIAKGEMEQAQQVYQRAIEASENPAKIFLKRGLRRRKLGYLAEALDDFLKAIALENGNKNRNQALLDSAYYHAAITYWKLEKNIEKSLSFLSRISSSYRFHDDVEKKKSELATRLLKQGLVLCRTQKITEALETFNLGLRYIPSSRLRYARGELYMQYYSLPDIQKIAGTRLAEDVLNLAIVDFETVLGTGKNAKAKQNLRTCEKLVGTLREKQAEAAMDAAERRRDRPGKSPRHQNGMFTPVASPKDDLTLPVVQINKGTLDGSRI